MAREDTYLLRLMSYCTKEFVCSAVSVTSSAAVFTSQLSGDNERKLLLAYNNTDPSISGDVYYGHSASVSSSNGRVIPKGADVEIPIDDGLDVYFVVASGTHDLRVFEGA